MREVGGGVREGREGGKERSERVREGGRESNITSASQLSLLRLRQPLQSAILDTSSTSIEVIVNRTDRKQNGS